MIKTRLVRLLAHARKYIVYQILWQWAALWGPDCDDLYVNRNPG